LAQRATVTPLAWGIGRDVTRRWLASVIMNRVHNARMATKTASRPRKWGDRAAKLGDIRDAASSILARDGLERLTMRAVAEQAGVSLGALYTHFASKEVLFATLYAERLEGLADEIETACADVSTAEDVLVRVAERYYGTYATFGREFNVWSMMMGDSDVSAVPVELAVRLVSAATHALDAAFDAMVRVEPALATVAREKRPLVVPLVWASVTGLAEHFSGARQLLYRTDRDELTRFTAAVLVRGLRGLLAEEAHS